jgi:hypothetical protein
MQRDGRRAEAERRARETARRRRSEFEAAARLAEAARLAMQLRYLQTLAEVGKGEGAIALLPLDIIGAQSFTGQAQRATDGRPRASRRLSDSTRPG